MQQSVAEAEKQARPPTSYNNRLAKPQAISPKFKQDVPPPKQRKDKENIMKMPNNMIMIK